jgi:hypothetical protein
MFERVQKIIVVLLNCIDFVNIHLVHTMKCHVRYHVISIKVEEVIDVEEEKASVLITFPVIRAEHEVSCVCVHFTNIQHCPLSFPSTLL